MTITGVEYSFEGVPADPPVGTALAFRNGGTEAHEMVVVRKLPGVDKSFQELLNLPEEEATKYVAIEGALMAAPGEAAEGTVPLSEPGDYALICFFPVGMTEIPASDDPNASIPAGPPHFTRGMFAELTVEK